MYINCNLSKRLVKFYQNLKIFRYGPKCPERERERPRTCLSGEEGIREEEESGDVVIFQPSDLQSLESVSMI
jgi:hypothetical protein